MAARKRAKNLFKNLARVSKKCFGMGGKALNAANQPACYWQVLLRLPQTAYIRFIARAQEF